MASQTEKQLEIRFPVQFQQYADAAYLRLAGLFPDAALRIRKGRFEVAVMPDEAAKAVRQEVLHAIYREKIYAETRAMRADLIAAVTKR